jgi:histidine ammonia-lyase
MTDAVVLRPGRTPLADWRAVYQGAPITLDWIARADVEAGTAALQASVTPPDNARKNGASENGNSSDSGHQETRPESEVESKRADPVERVSAEGEPLPASVARLILALKLGSLAQGASSAGWPLVKHLADCLGHGVVPVVRMGDYGTAPLESLSAALLGSGEMATNGETRAAAQALEAAGLAPPPLAAGEPAALASGAQAATALALAGLFEAEAVLQTALVTGAMSGEALRTPVAALHPALQRHGGSPGRVECAAALRALFTRNKPRPPEAVAPEAAGGAAALDLQAQVAGACLDLLRKAGEVLAAEANAVTESPLVLWQTGETVENRYDPMLTTMAADIVAIVLSHLGTLARRRIALLAATPPPPRRSGRKAASAAFAGIQTTAASLAAENRQKAWPASLAAESETEGDGAKAASLRLQRIAGNATLILAIELIAASDTIERSGRKQASDALELVREVLRARLPKRGKDSSVVPDLAVAADLIRSGAVAAAVGVPLPSVVRIEPAPVARRLGASGKRT